MTQPTKTNWPLLMLLLVSGLFAAAQFGKLTLTLGVLQELYPNGGLFVPILVSIVGMVGIAFGAIAGGVVAGLGLTRMLVPALFAGGVLSLVQASLPSLPIFAALRVAEGLSHLAIVVATPTLMASLSSDADRPFVMGIWAAFFGIAMALLAMVLPVLLSLGSLPLVLACHGAGMIAMGLVLWPALPTTPRGRLPNINVIREHRTIYSQPRLLIPGAGFVCYKMIYIALLGVLPLARGLPVWVTTALPLISIVGTIFGGWVAKTVPPDRLVAFGFLSTIFATGLALIFSAAIWPLLILFLVMSLIPAGSFAAIPYFNMETGARARATGGLAQLGNVGTTLGTPIYVLADQTGGFALMCIVTIIFCVIGLIISRILTARIS